MSAELAPPAPIKTAPNPASSEGLAPKERKFFCIRYNSCLDTAVEKKWHGFTCKECRAFSPVVWNAEDRMEDEIKCMALLMAVFYQRSYAHLSPGRIVEHLERETRWHQEFGGVLIS